MITYIEADLFSAPQDMLLVHACNCQGVWGSGIALQFYHEFEPEFHLYENHCNNYSYRLAGSALIINRVGCLFTSPGYAKHVAPPAEILINTELAVRDLLSKTTMKIAMPKINSGLFKVPWEDTEAVLNKFPNAEFYVYTGKKK